MKWNNRYIKDKTFKLGNWALLYDSRYKDNLGKLQTCWLGPCEVIETLSNSAVRLSTINPIMFKLLVNGHRLRLYHKPLSKTSFCSSSLHQKILGFLQQQVAALSLCLHPKSLLHVHNKYFHIRWKYIFAQ